ncbi:PTS system, mannose-specific IIC component [Lactobacillus selangorensis]|uniref:PTS system, mannose-specific IIC component n=2 Tax=Lactobacillus selangorensis TaxID=81857 RepID=A0A0R2FY43_9LACO|nr:PTS system, mannose-specific IIC component [Lactobacillus selangorensis]KRN30186.1 PTS system, mannose-specific IIC component [Lactobacillus selangorensis]
MYQIMDELTLQTSLSQPVWAGLIAGAIMGNMKAGLIIGGSLQLTVLGVGTFGGASKIDANSGTVLATAFSIGAGMNPQTAVAAIGVPVASLMIETDILARFTNTYFQHRVDHMIDKLDFKGIERNYLYGVIPWTLSRGIPVFLALAFGGPFVNTAVKYLNTNLSWLNNGLQTAGGLLPAVGFAILLRYLPVKKHIAYLILGFMITALFSTLFTGLQTLGTGLTTVDSKFTTVFNSLPMLAIALIGLAFAILQYKRDIEKDKVAGAAAATKEEVTETSDEVEGEINGDED